jgi:hypothetical protein
MKQKNHTQNEKIRRLEKVATQLYVRVVQLEKAVKAIQDKLDEDKTEGLNYL